MQFDEIILPKGTILYHKTTDITKITNSKYFSIFYEYSGDGKLYKCILKKEIKCIILIDKIGPNNIYGSIVKMYKELLCKPELDVCQDLKFKDHHGDYEKYKYKEQMESFIAKLKEYGYNGWLSSLEDVETLEFCIFEKNIADIVDYEECRTIKDDLGKNPMMTIKSDLVSKVKECMPNYNECNHFVKLYIKCKG